ncbi:MAG: hypothetical protein FD188_3585 [Ignavibacteria bacterium]|nr:MAG: hypothetical protein FD188_3585 [Ignavibacteria bacterium]
MPSKTELEINPKKRITHLFFQNFHATVEFFFLKFRIYFWVNSLILGAIEVRFLGFDLDQSHYLELRGTELQARPKGRIIHYLSHILRPL